MEIAINYWAILLGAVLSMVVGAIWYGPLFGKKWTEIIGATADDLEARKRMQREAGPLYMLQFVITLYQLWVFAFYVALVKETSALGNALWIWSAFIVPMIIGCAIWNNDPKKVALARILIQSGYQLVMFLIYAAVFAFLQ